MIMIKRFALSAVAMGILASANVASAADDLKIALITSKGHPALEPYAKQTETGFMMGLEYLTNGTMTINGRKIKVIFKDDQGKPDQGKTLLTEAYADDKVDIAVGTTSSGVSIAMLPIAAEYKKVLIVEAGVSSDITGKFYNRYIFKTSRNSYQDACSAVMMESASVAVLAQDNVFGHSGMDTYKECAKTMKSKATIVHEEFQPAATTDFTAAAQRMFDVLKDKPEPRFLSIAWAGANPVGKIAALHPERYKINLIPGGNILPVMKAWSDYAGSGGSIYYYYNFPKNKMNDWMVAEHKKRNNGAPPDFFIAGGASAASAVITAIQKTKGSTDTEKLIAAMEGMNFETPKGTMTFRKEDHQALQAMYQFRIKEKAKQTNEWDLLELVHEFKPTDLPVPVNNK